MSEEGFCPEHGPFDGQTCPYCGRSSHSHGPSAPRPLDEDDIPTDIRYGHSSGIPNGAYDDETDVPRHRARSDYGDMDGGERVIYYFPKDLHADWNADAWKKGWNDDDFFD